MKLFVSVLTIALLTVTAFPQIKTPQPPHIKVPFAESRQSIVVTTRDWNATQGEARLYERGRPGAKWTPKGEPFPVVVGRAGLAWAQDSSPEKGAQFKVEGDGKSPAGLFPLTFGFG